MVCPEEESRQPLVLVVDDDVTLRIVAREHLESAGFVVEEAVDGQDAVDRFRSLDPDAVLMDVVMPEMDGISACTEIRRLRGAETVPILILTAHDDIREIERAYAAGATDFTSKPVNWTVELHRLQYMLRAARVVKDLRARETELRHSQKMEAVGRLAGGVAHDFNNLLTAMTGFSQLAASQLPADHPAGLDLQEVGKAAQKATVLTRQLLTFSRREVPDSELVSLNEVVGEMEGMLRRLIGQTTELTVDLDPEVETIEANRNQIEQVIMNLVVNAADALEGDGKITIGTRGAELGGDESLPHGPIAAGRYAVLGVRDTGQGIDPALQRRIFEPFFTTKDPGKGTGLGLSTVYGIVQNVGGTIALDSQPGRGACFRAYFPVASHPAVASQVTDGEHVEQQAGSETVLVVEDDDAVRSIMLRVLRTHGYEALEACNGKEALDLVNGGESEIELVVSNLNMPIMGGIEVADHLRRMQCGPRLILTSGHLDLGGDEGPPVDSSTILLQKPFSPWVLLSTVREALDQRRARE